MSSLRAKGLPLGKAGIQWPHILDSRSEAGMTIIYKFMCKIQKNEGTWDRVMRFLLAFIAFFWAYSMTGTWAIVLYVVAAIALITSLTGFCGLYKLLGINTLKKPTVPPINPPIPPTNM